jgi:hypothetical protein
VICWDGDLAESDLNDVVLGGACSLFRSVICWDGDLAESDLNDVVLVACILSSSQ